MPTLNEGHSERPASELRTAFLLYLGAVAVLFATTAARVGIYDEGLILTGAMRVLHGEWPARDFYANYAPGQFALVAGAFKVLGTSMMSARIWDALSQGLLVPAVWIATRCVNSKSVRIAAVAMASALLIDRMQHLYPVTICATLAFVAGSVTARALTRHADWTAYWPVTPLLIALFFFRYDMAVGVGAALALAVVTVLVLQCRSGSMNRARAVRVVACNGVLLVVASAATLACLAGFGILAPAYTDVVTYLGPKYVAMRSLPFPGVGESFRSPLTALYVYFTPLALVPALVVLVPRLRRASARQRDSAMELDESAITVLVFVCLALPFFMKGTVRVSAFGMVPADIAMIVALAACATSWSSNARRQRWTMIVAGAALVLAVGGRMRKSVWLAERTSSAERFVVAPYRLEAANYLQAHSAPDDRIFSANGRHDRIVLNDVLIYFLARRLPGTRWHHFDPGVQTLSVVQTEMIADLERNGVRWIVRDTAADERVEPNKSAESSGVHLLDEYIARHFRAVVSFGSITILERASEEHSPALHER